MVGVSDKGSSTWEAERGEEAACEGDWAMAGGGGGREAYSWEVMQNLVSQDKGFGLALAGTGEPPMGSEQGGSGRSMTEGMVMWGPSCALSCRKGAVK